MTGRFLRASRYEGTQTEEESDDEERMNLNLSPAAEKWLAGLAGKSAAELEKLAQAPKNVNVEEVLAQLMANAKAHFINLAENGMTPSVMYVKNNIEAKLKMPESWRMRDPGYQEYVRFKDFWDDLPKELKEMLMARNAM
ncbi:hypothetical protein F442_02913 [Phytophthora nicotianae P10297]|uniref:Uncharacterized protein n=3 Tax=Phytophthora nicotianae TaxID=4792 RepID=V9FUV8_PHYNI|nr:hypothetical protein F443_02964 [Phytophthora nicotianae P1569]ETM00555.1 hypothetical protein L917_02736 [Phytophthora nicotianae]ETM53755.1 hypothetical protein L914_02800 [Phytophthora nicotianae]ETP52015.1 hypothetical protein F442_02913 [Phytophthora nicotianae P10297]